jgi:starch synthase (maltosyl-transferring)
MTDANPRIYYLHPLLAGAVAGWGRPFARAAQLGFDAVMIAPPFRAGRGGNLFRIADHHWLDDRLGGGEAAPALRRLADAARAEGLRLMLDLPIGWLAADSVTAREKPHWFDLPAPDALPDPRQPPGHRDQARFRYDREGEPILHWWSERLRAWQDCGIVGLQARGAGAAPGGWWRRLLAEEVPGLTAIADMTGAAPAQIADLAGRGFAFAVAATPCWEVRAGLDAVAAIAPTLAMPEAPFGPRVAAGARDAAQAERLSRRALGFAAFDGAAWLMPMGFEYGAARPMDAARDRPEDFAALEGQPRYDLTQLIAAANRRRTELRPLWSPAAARRISAPQASVTVLLRAHHADTGEAVLLVANPSTSEPARLEAASLLPELGGLFAGFTSADGLADDLAAGGTLTLPPAGVRLLRSVTAPPICLPAPSADAARAAAAAPRIAIEAVAPDVDAGRFPVKRVVGEVVTVTADIICDGHDKLAVVLLWRPADTAAWQEVRMRDLGNDRWTASFPLSRLGRHVFTVAAWKDVFATFAYELDKKLAAGVNLTLELEEGRRLLEAAGARDPALARLAAELAGADAAARLAALRDPATARLMVAADGRAHLVQHAPEVLVDGERPIARFAAWYEMFPRSAVGDGQTHGGFADVIARLPAISAMGFDVLYFPPIHPIGRTNRKGRNNTLTPAPDDPGSPYAIGSDEGGHDALHPQLGTFEDFRRLREAAAHHGLELALDFAIQCAPDHPWLRTHPEWFDWRPDGTIRYAENPPKKYEDIVNVDFYTPGAVPSLWIALRDVVLFWVGHGVRIFRVDNPHTKPLPFWEWLIGEVRGAHPDTMFLAEAFTKPKLMYRLAKLGFSQSYTYFTWRNTKYELTEYLTELTTTAPMDFFRPNFFVNTPDINPPFLQQGGRAAHLIRAALATMLAGLWGMYNGFEICEATPLPGREEYLDSEKYQIRGFDWDRPGNIVAEITRLNAIRRANPALHTHLGITFHTAYNDRILLFSKATATRDNLVLVAVSLDPFAAQEADIDLTLWQWGLADDAALPMEDLMRDTGFTWYGRRQHIRLDPADLPFAIWRVRLA